jgi:hypothetical protein
LKVSVSTRKECTSGPNRGEPKASPSNVVTKTTQIPIDIDTPVFLSMSKTGNAHFDSTGFQINTRVKAYQITGFINNRTLNRFFPQECCIDGRGEID